MDSVRLIGSGSDTDGYVVAYLWSEVSGPSLANIINNGSSATLVTGLVQGTYIFQLMVTDNDGLAGVDTISVIVNPNPIKTLSLQPANNPNEKMLVSIGGIDQSAVGLQEWPIDAWTVSGSPYFAKAIFKFDMSSISSSVTIISANLYLYSNDPPINGNFINANFGSNNALYLQQITSNWNLATVNWFLQPSTSVTNQISIPSTTSSSLDLNIDVTGMEQSMLSNNANYGFLLRLQNEIAYNSRAIVSSYNSLKPNSSPKLVITYK